MCCSYLLAAAAASQAAHDDGSTMHYIAAAAAAAAAAATWLQVRFLSLTFTDFEVCEQEVEQGEKMLHVVNDKQAVS
jgi:uncharacterized cupredoxin-like copper-binding protein